MSRNYLLFIVVAMFSACVNVASLRERNLHADTLASDHGWQRLQVPAGKFNLMAYVPKSTAHADVLTVYIEGDGLAWLSGSQPSENPTPIHPVGLELALHHPRGAAAYLARPCQYVELDTETGCSRAYWTGLRFSPEVVEASDEAVGVLKQRFGAARLVLVGYSGGGAVAALVAARRSDVIYLVSVAGNLDHRAWTEQHQLSPLSGSLNPADIWERLAGVPQLLLVGEDDRVVGRPIADSYASRFPPGHRPEIESVPGFDHECCWAKEWNKLLAAHPAVINHLQ